jgi:O-6-methylguanine DNA methyltransferase
MLDWAVWSEPGGVRLRLEASETRLRRLEFLRTESANRLEPNNPVLLEAIRELTAYFQGELREFTIPLEMEGTEFQKRVWCALQTIPYGETCSYRDLAETIGASKAVRAVGAANGANPLAIIVPCHRVIGANGKLTGYGGGLPLKQRLLELEQGSGHKLWRSFSSALSIS